MYLDIHPLLSIILSLLIINGFYKITILISQISNFKFLDNYAVQGKLVLFFFYNKLFFNNNL